jgi:response regulator RpfG family c-di-GMP phosphodiesterase
MYPILFVDDDHSLLKSFKRTLSREFKVSLADDPAQGLTMLEERGPFPVVVTDMKMPLMNGIEFLSRAQKISPDTVRILLTGHADQQTAIDAVNTGQVFRFLTKPCEVETLVAMLRAAARQHQLMVAERELLEQTLLGTVGVLSQILTLINPVAQGKANRLRLYCRHLAKVLHLDEVWLVEMAAMLSQLGCLTIPPEVITRQMAGGRLKEKEEAMVREHPRLAGKLLAQIPRLETVVEIVAAQGRSDLELRELFGEPGREKIHLLCRILQVSNGLDQLIMEGQPPKAALTAMLDDGKAFDAELVRLLASYPFGLQNMVRMKVSSKDLTTQMTLDEDVHTSKGMLLAAQGQKVTTALLNGILNYSETIGVKEPFAVLVPLIHFPEQQV